MKIVTAETHFPTDSDTNAADWWRTILPFTHLQKNTDWEIEIRRGLVSKEAVKDLQGMKSQEEWKSLGRDNDLVYYSYNTNPMNFSFAMVATQKFNTPLVMDFDDNILRSDLKNVTELISRLQTRQEPERVNQIILKEVPFITTTSNYIKKDYQDFLKEYGIEKPIYVIPNFIDSELFVPEKRIEKKEITIGFFGSTSHQADLHEKNFFKALQRIRREYPEVRLEIIGNFIPGTLDSYGKVDLIEGTPDIYEWSKLWQKHVSQWDIALAPLRDTPFNRSRSNIKYQETALASVPLIASDIGVYDVIRQGITGFLVNSKSEWYSAMKVLVENAKLRQQLGENARKDVLRNWTIQTNWQKWKETMKEIASINDE